MTQSPAPRDDPWADILAADEEIIWQGRPNGRYRISASDLPGAAMGLYFVGFSIFWMAMASRAGGVFWMVGLIFFFIGLRNAYKGLAGDILERRCTFYTLTNQRAIIGTDLPGQGRKLNTFPITATSPLALTTGRFDTVTFAPTGNTAKKHKHANAFADIDDGAAVFQMMTRIQKGETP